MQTVSELREDNAKGKTALLLQVDKVLLWVKASLAPDGRIKLEWSEYEPIAGGVSHSDYG